MVRNKLDFDVREDIKELSISCFKKKVTAKDKMLQEMIALILQNFDISMYNYVNYLKKSPIYLIQKMLCT